MTRNPARNSCSRALLILMAIAFASAGCKKQEQQPVAPQPAAVAANQAAPQPKPVQKPVSSALKLPAAPVTQFDFSTKKDPFKPFAVVKTAPVVTQEAERKSIVGALPIHSFDVSQFKLIGIVTGIKENRAMVTDPNGKGYVIKVGMTIGKNAGRVTAITTGGVDVVEQFRDDNGRVRREIIRIALPRKQ